MQVVRKDDVAIYNLTKGKQLPQWLSDRKKRKMQQEDPELQVCVCRVLHPRVPSPPAGLLAPAHSHIAPSSVGDGEAEAVGEA
jgi:hypothetical protein